MELTNIFWMRYILFFLFLSSGLYGQKLLLLPAQLDSFLAQDSLDLLPEQNGLRNNLRTVGTLNNRYPATLISEEGLVLVSREAIARYLPESTSSLSAFADPLPLKGLILTIPIETKDVTAQILDGSASNMSFDEQINLIQRNIGKMMMAVNSVEKGRQEVKRYQFQNRFFLHEYQDFTDLRLVFLSNKTSGKNYGIIQIFGESQLPKAPLPASKNTSISANYVINYPQKTYYQSSSSALELHVLELQSALKLLNPALSIYQSYQKTPSPSLTTFHQSQSEELSYLNSSQASANKISKENTWLLNKNIVELQGQLKLEKKNLEKLHSQYFMSRALNQSIKLIQLTQYLQSRAGRRSAQKQNILSYLANWQKDWAQPIDQALFSQLMTIYFEESRAEYFSTAIIDQIRSNNKSFEALGNQLYEESLLVQPTQLMEILNEEGTSTLFSILQKDIGYLFFTQLLRDQQERIFSPYRKELAKWSQLENQWLEETAGLEKSIIDANGSQRIHFCLDNTLGKVPIWKDTAGSPIFNQKNQLIGFLFPRGDYPAGLHWEVPAQVGSPLVLSIQEVMNQLKN